LENLANVHLVGVKPHEEIPQYIQQFDVCLIPYVLDAFTSSVSPAKLNEYLALGKPVVSSNLPEVEQFNREFGNVVDTAGDGDEFAARIRSALREQSAKWRRCRR
jgi:glycosyltransferase involved in cell wall biosynthesis